MCLRLYLANFLSLILVIILIIIKVIINKGRTVKESILERGNLAKVLSFSLSFKTSMATGGCTQRDFSFYFSLQEVNAPLIVLAKCVIPQDYH